jgi:outer membrane protein insertion porin family
MPDYLKNLKILILLFFADVADLWGVDYNSSIDGDGIRSSVGIGLDWFSPIGPMNFSLALPITKEQGDKTEIF